jgi:hypothetical protein
LVRESGTKLVVLNPPLTREFRERGYPKNLRREYPRYLTQAAGAEDFEYRDLDVEVTDLTEDDFLDFGHLNEVGSRKVSTYTAREVLLRLLKE